MARRIFQTDPDWKALLRSGKVKNIEEVYHFEWDCAILSGIVDEPMETSLKK